MSEESPRKKSKKGNAQPIEIPPIPNRPQQCNEVNLLVCIF